MLIFGPFPTPTTGLTGYVAFDQNQDRLASYTIVNLQSRTSGFVPIGSWDPLRAGIELSDAVVWSDGSSGLANAPVPFPERRNQVFASRDGVLVLAVCGAASSLLLLALVIKFKETNTIRAAAFPFCVAILVRALFVITRFGRERVVSWMGCDVVWCVCSAVLCCVMRVCF